jgi:hypothetical protein
MDRSDEYRKNAKLCQAMANTTRSQSDKSQWLKLAESWLGMIEQRTASEESSSEARKKGTGKSDSDSH